MTLPIIPSWFVAGIAAIWAALVLWKLFGERALVRSRDARRLERISGAGEERIEEARGGLAAELAQAGVDLAPATFNLLRLAGVVLGALVGPALGMPLLVGALLAGAAWLGPAWWVRERVRRRGLRIEKELPAALSRLAALLPLVTSMPQLLAMVAESLMPIAPRSPLAAELRRTAADLRDRGPVALSDLEARAPSPALATLAFNLRVYLSAGGEQAGLMAEAAARLQRLIAGRNTARAKASGAMTVARLLPLLLAGATLFTMQDPTIKAFYQGAAGQLVIVAVAGMMFAGYRVMQRMVEGVA
jgi:Flp pilus assembly protein TadB